jgi:hypothetical protein
MNPRKLYTRLKHLKYPKPWSSDLAQAQENELLSTLNHENENTHQQTNYIKEQLNKYCSDPPPYFEPFTIHEILQVLKKLPAN